MKSILVIPARYQSTRFPGKPLTNILGKSMIQRVHEQCALAFPREDIYVATEDARIIDHCQLLGIQALMTSDTCLTGTDRVAAVADQIEADYYINVQGDEPVFNPKDIKLLMDAMPRYPGEILNGYCAVEDEGQYKSVSVPKVVFRPDGRLLYMSRSPIPGNKKSAFHFSFRQVCAYAFPKAALVAFSAQKEKSPLEYEEDIEILRFLELGYEVRMLEMSNQSIPVDHPEDLENVLRKLENAI
jgi:3-deoxy-manno-octulosonate cytidylyltransferase (CMP-KDO synthetase)